MLQQAQTLERKKRFSTEKKNVIFHRMLFRMSSSWLVNQNKNHHLCIDFTFGEETDADSFYIKKKKHLIRIDVFTKTGGVAFQRSCIKQQ